MIEPMKILIDLEDVSVLMVEDHTGKRHVSVSGGPRPLPFCAECQREVPTIGAFKLGPALVFLAECHGAGDVVRFAEDVDGTLVALPCFQESDLARSELLEWLRVGAKYLQVMH